MTQPDPIQLQLDPSDYVQGLSAAEVANNTFVGSMRAAQAAPNALQRAMDLITPSRVAIAGLGALGHAAAGVQQEMLQLGATARTTHVNVGVLSDGMRRLARDMPISNAGARELVASLTHMGVASAGSERNVTSLARTFTQLGGATGEGPAALAAGFVQLNRSMNTGFSDARMGKLADSLTTVSAQSGASATGILQFSKAIAPMAQASGIGETKVLGISAAFSKLGDDGVGAASAFNKMIGDMNKSVREGSPDMATYAAIVGKTTANFQGLFKANPAEAITQVTEAIAKSGPQGQHQLEQLGLDGVRTQRYLQELSSSGGLRESIGQAQTGYGSGNTRKAAEEAFGGLVNSATRLRATTEQLVDAMGTPMLGAMTTFTTMLQHAAAPVSSFAGSRPMQDMMKLAVATAIPLFIGSKLIGTGGTAAMGFQAFTSGPARAALAGFMRGREGEGYEGGRYTRQFLGRVDRNEALATTQGMNVLSQRVFANMRSFGEMFGGGGGTGPSVMAGLRNTAGAGIGAMLRLQAEQMRLARTNFSERSLRMAPYGAPYRDFAAQRNRIANAAEQGQLTPAEESQLRAANRARLLRNAGSQGVGTGVRQLGMGLASVGYETGALGMNLAARAGRGLMRQLGPIGVGVIGYEALSAVRSHAAEERSTAGQATTFIDDYRVAMGKATDATQTFAGRMQATADSMASGVSTMAQALKIDANRVKGSTYIQHPVETFSGDTAGVAAQIRLQGGATGMAPDEMARLSMDLIKQYGPQQAQQILTQVGASGGNTISDVQAAVHGFDVAKGPGGVRGFLGSQRQGFGLGAIAPFATSNSAPLTFSSLSKNTKAGVDALGANLVTQRAKDEELGGDYANKQLTERMNAAVNEAIKDRNGSLVNALVTSFQSKFDSGAGGFHDKISVRDIQNAGGFVQAQAERSKAFKANVAFDNNGQAVIGTSFNTQRAANTGGERLFAQGMGPDMFGKARSALTAYMTAGTSSPSAQTTAVNEAIRAYSASGVSMDRVAAVASKMASHFDDATGAANQFAMALHSAALTALQNQPKVLSQGAAGLALAPSLARDAAIVPTNDNDKKLRDAGVAGLQALQDQTKQYLVARLTAQREYQVSSIRSQQDYQLQVSYSNADFTRQMLHASQDFELQRFRATRDNTLNMLHAEQDYQRQRTDTIQDGSRAAYSAYQRLAVQPTWDAPNLIGNITEQTQALNTQVANLAKIRKAGASSTAIQLLGLDDPKNAQQLASLVTDMANDPKVVTALNSAAGARQAAGEKLVQDPANIALSRSAREHKITMDRSQQQFHTAMSDMDVTYRTSVARATEEHDIAMGRMADANTKMVNRAKEDLVRADQEITGDLTKLSNTLNSAVKGNYVDFNRIASSSMGAYMTMAKKFSTDWRTLTAGLGVDVTITPHGGTPVTNGGGTDPSVQAGHGAATLPKPKPQPTPQPGAMPTFPSPTIPGYNSGLVRANSVVEPTPLGGITGEQAGVMSTSAAASHVVYDSSTNVSDYSVTVEKVEVQGVSMDDAIVQTRQKVAQGNLTRAPQLRR